MNGAEKPLPTLRSILTTAVGATVGIALPRFGNAGAWYGNAPGFGYSVGTAPAAMSIIVWSNHVGFVTEVSEDGSMVYIKEGGYCGGYHEGWWPSQGGRNGQAF